MLNKKMTKDFNIIICGVGGQGIITLLNILAQAAFIEGHEVRSSELHGLSQRGGSVEAHLRFGQKIYSPLVSQAGANLVLALEAQESLKNIPYANSKTLFLLNKYFVPVLNHKPLTEKEVIKELRKISKNIKVVEASQIAKEDIGNPVLAGVFLASWASFKGLIPLKPESISRALKKVIPQRYLAINQKAFKIAKEKS